MTSKVERQKAYHERKRAMAENLEFEQFLIDTPSCSSTTDYEKYEIFKSHRLSEKLDERRPINADAEAARERRKRKRVGAMAPAADNDGGLVPTNQKSRRAIRKRKRADAARAKYRRYKRERVINDLGLLLVEEIVIARNKVLSIRLADDQTAPTRNMGSGRFLFERLREMNADNPN